MTPDWLITISPIVGLVVNVALQVAVVHLTQRIGLSIIVGALGGLAAALAEATLNLPPAGGVLNAIAVWVFVVVSFLGFAYNYWVFLNLNITSLRIRTLRDLLEHEEGVSLSNIMAQYSLAEMLRRRLERLEHGKQITCTDGRYQLASGKLMILHHTLAVLRAIILPASARNG